ncbi:hypothetical protein [Cerasicoccus frondis]|uniref:hypothetical protein n=1 Tax=Cerasicoccus frondis TaxID=490090 RepID=UPI002852C498|nr:hypothetical protein [Cerasicoccus frondis]
MSFYIYHQEGDRYRVVAPLKLTSSKGVLAKFLQSKHEEDTPFTWQLSDAKLIELAAPELDPKQHVIAIDMMPESLVEVCLFRVTFIQGSSEYDESEVVLASKLLEQGKLTTMAQQFKKDFTITPGDRTRQSLEAMRLTGGTTRGNYFWAKPKMDIGAAVCPSTQKPAEMLTK